MDINKPFTWRRYRDGLCHDCYADCCKMLVEVSVQDLVKMQVIEQFDADGPLKDIAKNLKKSGVIKRFNQKHETFTLAQFSNRDCVFLNQETRKCNVYENRPNTCRDNPEILGPRPGFCPYERK